MEEMKAIVEAALFLSEDPLDTEELAEVMDLGSKGFVQQVIDELKEDLADEDRGLKIVESDDGYELVVKSEHVDAVEHLAPHRDLNEAELRTLALIAYNAPVKQSKVVDVRGNRAYGQIKELVKRGFVAAEKAGRTKELDVTDRFLDYFDLDTPGEFARTADQEVAVEEPGAADVPDDPDEGGGDEAVAADSEGEDITEQEDADTEEDVEEDQGPTTITDPVVSE